MATPPGSPISWLLSYASRLRHPHLFLLTLGLFALDLVVPDVIPFADEILLGLMSVLLGTWRDRRGGSGTRGSPVEKDITPGKSNR